MKVFKDNDLKLFNQIASLEEETLLKTLGTFLMKQYGDNCVIATNEYIVAKGDIPVALVAHLDTVFEGTPDEIYFDSAQGVMWSPQGLGADDRAGVFAILKIIRSGFKPHVIFTTGEEIGGKGAAQLVMDFPNMPFDEVKYFIELDRQGVNDCVFYNCANHEFIDYVEEFGFLEAFGSFSDISILCPNWGIAGVNLSVGYTREHTYRETLNTAALQLTIDRVIKMLKNANNAEKFEYVYSKYSQYDYLWRDYLDEDYSAFSYDSLFYEKVKCDCCGKSFYDFDVIPVKGLSGETKFYCSDCIVESKIGWCHTCNEAYEIDETGDIEQCRDCRKMSIGGSKCSKKSKNSSKK